jgi:hypothetical protein
MSKQATKPNNQVSIATVRHSAVVDTLMRLLGDIRYGSIEITVHDATVVQIERKEKIRL